MRTEFRAIAVPRMAAMFKMLELKDHEPKRVFAARVRLIAFISIFMLSTPIPGRALSAVDQLRQDLVGKSFTLATDIAGTTCMMTTPLAAADLRFVDTEIDEAADTRFYMRDSGLKFRACDSPAGTVNNLQGTYVTQNMISQMFPKGSVAIVKSVVTKPDRIEIQLVPDKAFLHDSDVMKIKLMLGKGYESHSLEQVEAVLSRALVLQPLASPQQGQGAAALSAAEPALTPVPLPPLPVDAPRAPTKTVALGQSKDQVVAILGQPLKVANLGSKEIDFYSDMKIVFVSGAVADIQ
jgi:hypothetical protein